MGRTIIQPIGPLYGEAVNGTVFGRPNGSIYIPETNDITYEQGVEYLRNYTQNTVNYIRFCNSVGSMSKAIATVYARSQDAASNIQIQISDDADFAAYSFSNAAAGSFNLNINAVLASKGDVMEIVDGTTYYVRAQLIASSGVAVATSETIEYTGWAEE